MAGLAAVANAATIATGQQDTGGQTRLGNEITQDMSARDAAAARRKRGLDLREQAAKAASARLAADAEARKKQDEAQQQMAGGPGAANPADSQFDELARIYQAMKPKAAAVVFEQLDMEVQMKVAQRMRERSTAMIMAAMTPKGAAALSMAMARRNAGARPAGQPQTAAARPQGGAPAARR
ncbi:MotE family protein [Sphingomonas sp. Sphisp66]|uniref:MotE family protein n=1 Tax=Sphingomonas sp. Sphisp66 TaxID=3243051 RepID=UPI0039B693C8